LKRDNRLHSTQTEFTSRKKGKIGDKTEETVCHELKPEYKPLKM